jgi:hypothetical protein
VAVDFYNPGRNHHHPDNPLCISYKHVRLICLGIPYNWPVGKEADYIWGETKLADLFEKRQCLYCLDDFLWRQRNSGIQRHDQIYTGSRVMMVYTMLGSLRCSETPEHDFFMVDENSNKIIDFLYVPWLPTNTSTQVDMESLHVGWMPPFGRKWDCKWTQTEEEAPASTEERAVQTDDHPPYGTTDYWLDVSSSPQNSTSQSSNP